MLRKIIKRRKNTHEKLYKKYKPIYGVFIWAGAGVRKFPVAAVNPNGMPMVYYYNDHNGTADQYELTELDWTTSGDLICWTNDEAHAKMVAKAINKMRKEEWRNKE